MKYIMIVLSLALSQSLFAANFDCKSLSSNSLLKIRDGSVSVYEVKKTTYQGRTYLESHEDTGVRIYGTYRTTPRGAEIKTTGFHLVINGSSVNVLENHDYPMIDEAYYCSTYKPRTNPVYNIPNTRNYRPCRPNNCR